MPEVGKQRNQESDHEELFEIARDLLRRDDPNDALTSLVHRALNLLGGKRGFLVLRQGEELDYRVIRNWSPSEYEGGKSPISKSILNEVFARTTPLLIEDATNDPRFSQQHSVRRLMIRSVLAAPIFVEERPEGVLYLESGSTQHFFGEEEFALFQKILELSSGVLEDSIRRALIEKQQGSTEKLFAGHDLQGIVTHNSVMLERLATLIRVAPSHLPVLIQGESGAGKERFAKAVHQNSARRDKTFLIINCGAISPSVIESELFGYQKGAFTGANQSKAGLIAAAHQGTLFLDEIGELPREVQAKMLRAVQFGEVLPVGATQPQRYDVRFVAATNRDLAQEVKEGRFRQDLLYRLNAVTLKIPPLRERPDDALLLFECFLREGASRLGRGELAISGSLRSALKTYSWPGNAREMENEAHLLCTLPEKNLTAKMLSPHIQEELLAKGFSFEEPPPPISATPRDEAPKTLEQHEKQIVEQHLRLAQGNKSHAAKSLGVSRETFRQMLKRHGIQ